MMAEGVSGQDPEHGRRIRQMEGHLSRLGWSEEEKRGEDEGKFGSVLKGPERGAQWVVFKCSVEWGKR